MAAVRLGSSYVLAANLRDDCWRMVGVYNLSFGLGYNSSYFNCMDIGISIGYEFHQWINHPDFLNFQAEAFTDTIVSFNYHTQDLGFDGLFVRLSLGF